MNTYLQTQEKRKFKETARQENAKPISFWDFVLLGALGLLAAVGFVCIMAAVAKGIID